jgi:hypothetical protein
MHNELRNSLASSWPVEDAPAAVASSHVHALYTRQPAAAAAAAMPKSALK